MASNTVKKVPHMFARPFITVMGEDELRNTFRKSEKGHKIHYYTGFMAIEAETDERIATVRKVVADWASMGMVSLTQRRIAPYAYEYYAVVL